MGRAEALPMDDIPFLPDSRTLAAFCRKHHIRRLSLFGSRLTGSARPDSDVDLLVEFETGHVPGYFRYVAMQMELSEMAGLPVDLRTSRELSHCFRDEVAGKARELYAV